MLTRVGAIRFWRVEQVQRISIHGAPDLHVFTAWIAAAAANANAAIASERTAPIIFVADTVLLAIGAHTKSTVGAHAWCVGDPRVGSTADDLRLIKEHVTG